MELENFPAFKGLSGADIDAFIGACKLVEVPAGKRLITQDERADHLLFVVEGKLKVLLATHRGEQEVAAFSAPSVLGEIELFGSERWSAGVVAETAVQAYAISYSAFRERMEAGDISALRIVANFAKVLAQRLELMNERVATLFDQGAGPGVKELQDLKQKLYGEWSL